MYHWDIREICGYLLTTPRCKEEAKHKVRLVFGNGLRPEIWSDFVGRFNIPNIAEFYGSTEGNSNIINFDNTVGAVGFVPELFSSILPLGLISRAGNLHWHNSWTLFEQEDFSLIFQQKCTHLVGSALSS